MTRSIRHIEEDRGAYAPPKRIPIVNCGRHRCPEVECYDFTNTCERCGADFNFAGQELAPREQWGCETNEPWWECY